MLWKIVGSVLALFVILFLVLSRISSTAYVEYTLNAPMDRVWPYWVDGAFIQKYWGPYGYHSPSVKSDFRVDGKFLLAMQPDSGGDIVYNAGVYKEILPMQKIVAEMFFSDAQGNILRGDDIPVPGKWPDVVVVTTEFKNMNGKTLVTVREEGIPMLMKFLAEMGWKQQFEKLDVLLKQ